MKKLIYKIEFYIMKIVLFFIKLSNIEFCSNVMGSIFRYIGPFLPISSIAMKNIHIAFPSSTKCKKKKILCDCWENIGRSLAELSYISELPFNSSSGAGWFVQGSHWLCQVKKSKRPIIFFSGHFGNWEIMPTALAHFGLPFASLYRAPNNPYVNQFLSHQRQKNVGRSDIPSFPKGAKGARSAMRYLAQGGHIGILGDQKMNDGICAQFFNRPTMTAPAAAALALRFNALIVTGYVQREGAGRLVLHVFPPIDPQTYALPSETRHRAIQRITQLLNDRLQEWIIQNPGNWLWLHRRWDKKLYR